MPSRTANVLLGGLVSLVLSFTAVSPLLGGAVAGYLEREDGLRVGAFAGVVATVAVLLLFVPFVLLIGLAGAPIEFGALFAAMLLFVGLYTVGLSAVGGAVGVWLYEEYGDELPV